MKVALIYVHPTAKAPTYVPLAKRFVQSYMKNPPGETEHDIHVVINGSIQAGDWSRYLFNPLPCQFMQHNNYGKDIGAYQSAADVLDCDLMVCMGAPIHFHRPGWLDRIVMAYYENGPGLYGAWGFHHPLPHLRTTVFWCPPELLNAYPHRVDDNFRYAFEHGPDSITLWSQKQGFEPMMVTWAGTYPMDAWRPISKEESLMVDQHMAPSL